MGKRWFQKQYGVDVRIGWNPDSFGYNWQLPQIYKRSGIDYFVTQKMTWNDTNQLPFKLFWWESPDGSKVLTYFPHDYANDNLNPVRLSADLAQARKQAPGMTEMMDLYGVGDHGGGPTRAILDEGVHWMQPDKVVPKMKFGTGADLLHRRREQNLAPNSPVWDYASIAKGYTLSEAAKWQDCDSDMEGRDVLRVSPRRDDHAGQPQAQHARERGAGTECGEVCVACLARGQMLIPAVN